MVTVATAGYRPPPGVLATDAGLELAPTNVAQGSPVRVVEKLRSDAVRRFANDEELETVEQELRRDLHQQGSQLSWDSTRRELQQRIDLPTVAKTRPIQAAPAQRTQSPTSPLTPHAPHAPLPSSARPRPQAGSRSGEEDDDGFGEDQHDVASASAAARAGAGGAHCEASWRVRSQQPWRLGKEHCSLTISENSAEGLVQFELLKYSDKTTMYVTCTNAQFDGLCHEQTGLSGTAQVNAAISQLFQEAHDEIKKPDGGQQQDADLDGFGEDFDEEPSVPKSKVAQDAHGDVRWHIRSQQPWHLGKEHCTLTILENSVEGLVQFELVKYSTRATMHVTCTNAQFEGLCQEQTGLSGAAQINAAISQLFQEAHDEVANSPSQAHRKQSDDLDDFGKDSPLSPRSKALEDFGEDCGEQSVAKGSRTQGEPLWHIRSQQPWHLGKESCTLTILENSVEGLVQFQLLKYSNQQTMHVTCTDAQFDGLCREQTGLSGAAQINAAISQLFQEAHDEIDKSPGPADRRPPSPTPRVAGRELKDDVDDFGEEFGDDFGMATSKAQGANEEVRWRIRSQQPWQLGMERCTLTLLENSVEGLVQFELIKYDTQQTMHVTCTNAQFDELCKEQVGLTGTAQVNAAIAQLFQEAHEEIRRPE